MVVRDGKGVLLVLRPFLSGFLAHQLLQRRVAALLGKFAVVDLAQLVELHKLVVQLHDLAFALGHDPDHPAGDRQRVKEFQHARALVAFLDVEGRLVQDRHVVVGKRADSAARFGADDQLSRDLDNAEINAGGDVGRGHDVVQHRQKRRLTFGETQERYAFCASFWASL